jgi:hypothetical protein
LWVFFRDSKQGFIGNNFKTAKQEPVLPSHIRNTKQRPVLPSHIRSAKQWPVNLSHIRNAKQRVITKLGRNWYPLQHKQTMFVTSKRSRHWVNLNPHHMAPNVLTNKSRVIHEQLRKIFFTLTRITLNARLFLKTT